MSSTRDKLERLYGNRRPAGAPENGALKRLESELLGVAATTTSELSLKERLERLVAVAQARPRRVIELSLPRARDVVDLERAFPDGKEVRNGLGAYFSVDRYFPLDHRHGRIELDRLLRIPRESFSVLARGSDGAEIDLERALFLDTETTGLAGGSGTYAFLIGVGFVEDGAFVLRQLFMRDYREEAAMLRGFVDLASRFELLVSYNGKSFDVPLLETRFVLTRQAYSLEEKLHFDLLHPARSLWKARFESCRLVELEQWLLGIERENDVPGHLIADIYFRFVRTSDATELPHVFEHNANDILSLAALTVSASDMLDEENPPDHPIDDFSLGRLFERVENPERSMLHYERAVESGVSGAVRRRSLRGLAELHKRKGEVEKARELWEQLSREDGLESVLAYHELAMHLEHRARDYGSALAMCDSALERLDSRLELPIGFRERWRDAFEYRLRRLRRKVSV
jgi:uncharacterized protein YprB with RNaseH-like and TPR domain